jgi:hypothetical protein
LSLTEVCGVVGDAVVTAVAFVEDAIEGEVAGFEVFVVDVDSLI